MVLNLGLLDVESLSSITSSIGFQKRVAVDKSTVTG